MPSRLTCWFSNVQTKPRLTLTRPKEPELETSQRVRSVKIKSTAELEEEMMAKIPKFKARPLNKKVSVLFPGSFHSFPFWYVLIFVLCDIRF